MSEQEPVVETPISEKLYEEPESELDTEGTPSDEEVAEDDGALAADKAEDEESDTDDDGTPDDEESDDDGYEQRFKDTQAKLTEASQALAELKKARAEEAGQVTEASIELNERLTEVEGMAQFYADIAEQDLKSLSQVNVRQLSQEEYAQWQQQSAAAQQRSMLLKQRLDQVKAYTKQAKEGASKRTAQVARAQLLHSIDNFDEVYPEIAKFAVDYGVSRAVMQEITDPGLIQLIHEFRNMKSQPDAIEEVTKKARPKRKLPSARVAPKPAPKTLADKLYGS
jgi:hypothetical protein